MKEELRKVFEDQVKEKILGPGYAKDIIECSDDALDEIIDDNPLKLYSTGVMTPFGSKSTDIDDDGNDDGDDGQVSASSQSDDDDDDDDDTKGSDKNQPEKDDRAYFESDHIGIITCLSPETQKFRLEVAYAKYKPVDNISTVKIKAGYLYDSLKNIIEQNDTEDAVNQYLQSKGLGTPFSSLFVFNEKEKTVTLSAKLDNSINQALKKSQVPAMELLKKMIRGNFFQREQKSVTKVFSLADLNKLSDEEKKKGFELSDDLEYFVKSFPSKSNDKIYLKILVRNRHQTSGDNSEALYKHCLFQSVLKLTPIDGKLITYTEPIVSLDDDENNINEFIYREVVNYGKGVGCAVEWDVDGKWIKTTYMPRCEVRKFSNEISDDDIKNICTLRNLSKWSEWSDKDILEKLSLFVSGYETWHNTEKGKVQGVDKKYEKAKKEILSNQEALLTRLRENIDFMTNNPEALECFKIANTAMLIQMVVAHDSNFEKNRDQVADNVSIYDSIDYFKKATYLDTMNKQEPSYRPFQLAFLLMNVKSTIVEDDPYRTKYVDLIWFPTGGGKTEAYLALTALTIIARRRNSADIISDCTIQRDSNYTNGVSVIMRYTLRLLTSQQFERASFLICALDFLREKDGALKLGDNRITIGLWVGKGTTPNDSKEIDEKNSKYAKFLASDDAVNNPFPVAYCPWCGKKLKVGKNDYGYEKGLLGCLNNSCHFLFNYKLPVYYTDDKVYNQKPTLLFATVDKFAQLYTSKASHLLRAKGYKSPDLIIQDELHLISGPLGSTVSLFESVVEELASYDGHRPKIIASTATTRNTGALIKSLYGKNREVNIFPAQGTSYKDNYFSHLEDEALRCHIGVMPTSRTTSNDTETRLTATLILSRAKLAMKILTDAGVDILKPDSVLEFIRDDNHYLNKDLDIFWSIVLYYNSLKDLGRSKSRASQEVYENLRAKLPYYQIPQSISFVYNGFDKRKKEFTSREDSSRIKKLLTDAESCAKLEDWGNGVGIGGETMDLIYASNMISVGIDINRWNLMVMVGQPRSTSEYIQSSSRVARSHKGLVYNLINPQRIREFSLFENYTSFHTAYYKYVEPLSATPLNSQMLKLPLWLNIVDCYKNYICSDPNDKDAVVNGIMNLLKDRYDIDEVMEEQIQERLAELYDNSLDEKEMMSLRDIDPNCYILVKH